ncbi:MAG: hypothetical protein ABIS01_12540, partial [Ferruginibacter sp.]
DDIISNRVKAKLNNQFKVYNMAPVSFSGFDYYLKKGFIKKPRLMIYSKVERFVSEPLILYDVRMDSKIKEKLAKVLELANMNVFIDKGLRHFSIEWMRSRIHGVKGLGIPAGRGNSNMYFLDTAFHEHREDDLHTTANAITSYKRYCDSLGIHFLYIPMPDKETVYYDLVPFPRQPDYLLQLDSMLQIAKIPTINTVKLYNDYRQKNSKFLYNLDDTHWNSNATELLSKEIVNEINLGLIKVK